MLLKERIALFKSDANEVLHFRVVRDECDVTASWFPSEFTPEMTHQVFGDAECIFGYRGLNIKYYLCATSMRTFLSIKYDEAVTPDRFEGLQADDIERSFARHMPPGVFTRLDSFLEAVRSDAHMNPFGTLVRAYRERVADVVTCPRTVYSLRRREIERGVNQTSDSISPVQNGCSNGNGSSSNDEAPPPERNFEIYKLTAAEGGPAFLEFHERLQTMLLFFVDAASFIDMDDDRWRFYLLYERYQTPEGSTRFALLGYMTVYEYFAYPHSLRPRVSQVLVFPPYQRGGHGTRLLQHFYDECRSRPEVIDIPVEDPSENYQRMRDTLDCRNAVRECPLFAIGALPARFTVEMAAQAAEILKLVKCQAWRVYEILRLYAIETEPTLNADATKKAAAFRDFRLTIKQRLNSSFLRRRRDVFKLEAALSKTELQAAVAANSIDVRHKALEAEFQRILPDYRSVVEKLLRGPPLRRP